MTTSQINKCKTMLMLFVGLPKECGVVYKLIRYYLLPTACDTGNGIDAGFPNLQP